MTVRPRLHPLWFALFALILLVRGAHWDNCAADECSHEHEIAVSEDHAGHDHDHCCPADSTGTCACPCHTPMAPSVAALTLIPSDVGFDLEWPALSGIPLECVRPHFRPPSL